ncbi:MAG: hypothetical protein Q8J60_08525, partial [Thiobacillus sp.]|nr:hypothetical protein [Thiobacillus sp.]
MQAEFPAALSADVTVRSLETIDLARWDAYVNAHPDATFFHRAGWRRVIGEAFGHRTHFLLAERGGEVVGVLPLAEIDSREFARLARTASSRTLATVEVKGKGRAGFGGSAEFCFASRHLRAWSES